MTTSILNLAKVDTGKTPDPHDVAMVIYHGDCIDGFTAAWCVRRAAMLHKFPLEVVAGTYGVAPPDVTDRHVILVDFSYSRETLQTMAQVARSVTVLDHHKTAQEALVDLPPALPFAEWTRKEGSFGIGSTGAQIAAQFDMTRSGAGMAWDFFFPDTKRPRLVNYAEDYDLWRFNLRYSRELHEVLDSYPMDFITWDRLAEAMEDTQKREMMVQVGVALSRAKHANIARLLTNTTRTMKIGGHDVPVANLPHFYASEGTGRLAEGQPFAASYYDRSDGARVFSLRSRGDGALDVSEIAKKYGGGGHKNAAGFTASQGWTGEG